MRKIRSIIETEVDEAGEIAALQAEAKRLAAEVAEGPPPFKFGDVVRFTTGRRSAPKDALAVIFAGANGVGDYLAVYVDKSGYFRVTGVKRNQAEIHSPE